MTEETLGAGLVLADMPEGEIWTEWEATIELRRFDETDKLTSPRLQQRWRRGKINKHGHLEFWEHEWRDVPLVWEPGGRPTRTDLETGNG